MAVFAVTPVDATFAVQVGENTAAAAASATLAQGFRDEAEGFADDAAASVVDAGVAVVWAEDRLFYETLDPSLLGTSGIPSIDLDGRLLGSLATGDGAEASSDNGTALFYETLDADMIVSGAGVAYTDADGRRIATLGEDTAALSVPFQNVHFLRQLHSRFQARLRSNTALQIGIAFIGDSFTHGQGYFLQKLAKYLQDKYGLAAQGWTSCCGASGAPPGGGYINPGTQPTFTDGSVRADLVTRPLLSGAWTGTYASGAQNTPTIGKIVSTTAGDYVDFPFFAGHNGAEVFTHDQGLATGVVRYSWNGGGAWSSNVNLGAGANSFSTTGIPSMAGTLRVEVVSGSVGLVGVNFKSSTTGVVIHKLGATGSNSGQWAAITSATWSTEFAKLDVRAAAFLLATNDQLTGGIVPLTTAANVKKLIDAVRLNGSPDILVASPYETPTTAYTKTADMPEYAAALAAMAEGAGAAFFNWQPLFGDADSPADYEDGSALPLVDPDDIHPSDMGGATAAGGYIQIMESFQ